MAVWVQETPLGFEVSFGDKKNYFRTFRKAFFYACNVAGWS
jgi:hypothetical protein